MNRDALLTPPASRGAFVYRINGNGSIDSICILCYRTAAREKDELALHKAESEHVCEEVKPNVLPWPLARRDLTSS
jgi:hypothetical protein